MKKMNFTFLVAILLVFATHTMAQLPGNVPTSGLVGYWPFTGNANDLSGNGFNGSVNGAVLTTDRFGTANNAYNFDGSNDEIVITHNSSFNFTQFTISCWALKDNQSLYIPGIISKVQTNNLGWYLVANSNISDSICFEGGISSGNYFVAHAAALTPNQWVHIVGTFSPGTQRIYINGVLMDTDNNPGNLYNSSENIRIGFKNGDSYWGGKIDDIGIWNRVLTQQEITSLYTECSFTTTISAGGPISFCQGNNVVLSSIHQGSPYTFQWLLNGSSIGSATNYNYTATASGNYSVVVDSLGCSDTSNVITVTVNSLPTVLINAIPAFVNYFASPLTLTGNPSGGTFSGSGITGNSFNPTTAGLGSHSLSYNYTDGNSCSNSATISSIVYDTLGVVCTSYDTVTSYISVTDTLIIDAMLTGIAPPNNVNTMKVYPNPAKTHITIDNGDYISMAGYTIRIDNNLSQTVFTQPINQPSFYIDLSSWTGNGLYFVYIIDNLGNTIEIKKIVLQ